METTRFLRTIGASFQRTPAIAKAMRSQIHQAFSPCSLRTLSARQLARCYYHSLKQHSTLIIFQKSIPSTTQNPPIASRTEHYCPFATSAALSKKGGKENSKSNIKRAEAKVSGETDPFDFSDYESAISKAHENLRSEVLKLKAGGRDVDAIEKIRVNLGKGGKAPGGGGKASEASGAKIGDLASVVQRGRNVVVMVGEKDVCTYFPRYCPCAILQFQSDK